MPVDGKIRNYSDLANILFNYSIATKNMNLSTDLEIKSYTEDQLQQVLEKFKAIRLEAATEEPQSSNLSESLDLGNIENYITQLKKVLEEYERLQPPKGP